LEAFLGGGRPRTLVVEKADVGAARRGNKGEANWEESVGRERHFQQFEDAIVRDGKGVLRAQLQQAG
jgi:hypothetical protein